MDEDFIRGVDNYWYKIKKDNLNDGLCVRSANKTHYTVYSDRYIIGIDNHLYKIANKNSSNGISIKGNDSGEYYVENKPIYFKVNYNTDHLKDFECDKANPIPIIKYDGNEIPKCNSETGICNIKIPDGDKFLVGRPKGYKYIYDGNKVWLERE